jgi:hypothetical protein
MMSRLIRLRLRHDVGADCNSVVIRTCTGTSDPEDIGILSQWLDIPTQSERP